MPRALTRITFGDGLQTDATFSPDGRFIAYASDRGGHFNIWVQSVAGGDPVQVTKSDASDTQPDWSPDGSTIVFRSERDGGGIYLVPALGGAGAQAHLVWRASEVARRRHVDLAPHRPQPRHGRRPRAAVHDDGRRTRHAGGACGPVPDDRRMALGRRSGRTAASRRPARVRSTGRASSPSTGAASRSSSRRNRRACRSSSGADRSACVFTGTRPPPRCTSSRASTPSRTSGASRSIRRRSTGCRPSA